MYAHKKYVPILCKILLTFMMTQALEMKNYGKVNMYSIARNACVGYWTKTIKVTISAESCRKENI